MVSMQWSGTEGRTRAVTFLSKFSMLLLEARCCSAGRVTRSFCPHLYAVLSSLLNSTRYEQECCFTNGVLLSLGACDTHCAC